MDSIIFAFHEPRDEYLYVERWLMTHFPAALPSRHHGNHVLGGRHRLRSLICDHRIRARTLEFVHSLASLPLRRHHHVGVRGN